MKTPYINIILQQLIKITMFVNLLQYPNLALAWLIFKLKHLFHSLPGKNIKEWIFETEMSLKNGQQWTNSHVLMFVRDKFIYFITDLFFPFSP